MVPGAATPFLAWLPPQWVPVMGFDCRGLEPISCKLGEFLVKSTGGGTFEADLEEG